MRVYKSKAFSSFCHPAKKLRIIIFYNFTYNIIRPNLNDLLNEVKKGLIALLKETIIQFVS